MKTLLRLHSRRDHDHRALREMPVQQRHDEGMRRRMDAVERQCAARLRAFQEGLRCGRIDRL